MNEFLLNNILLLAIILVCSFSLFWPMIQKKKGGPEVNTDSAIELINRQNAQIIDLRDRDAFKREHIANAINVPATSIQNSLNLISKDRPVLLVDKDGQRTHMAASLLRGVGYKSVYVLHDGLNGWRNSGVPFSR